MKKDCDLGNGNPDKAYLRARRLLPYLALAVLLAFSVAGWRFYQNLSQEREQQRFEEYVDTVVTDITVRLDRYKMILQGGAGVFMASESVSRDEWRAYDEYRQVHTLYPGILGIGFATLIRPEDLPRHIEQVRAEGFPDYTVRPAGEREVYTSIIFLEPFDAVNQRAFGYDMFSEPVRRQAMARARDTGRSALTGRLTLVQNLDGDTQPGAMLYMPVYPRGVPLETVADRRAAIQGYVYAPFRIGDLMDGIFPSLIHEIDFQLYDGAEVSPSSLMYDSHLPAVAADAPRQPMFTARRSLDLYGHQWTLDFETMPTFEAAVDRHTPWVILAGGVLVSLLLFLLHRALTCSADRAQLLADSMTAALREREARYRVLTDTLPVGVNIIGPNMEIKASNAVYRRWFPNQGAAPCSPCYAVYNDPPRTEPCPGCPVVLTFQDGQPHVVEREAVTTLGRRTLLQSTTPLFGSDGKVAQVHVILEDITERKQMEKQIAESRNMYQSVVDTQQELISRYLPDTTLVFTNAAYCRAFGKSPDELLGQKYLMFLPHQIHEEEIASLNRLTPDKPSAMREYCILLPDGSSIWHEWEDQAFFDENGKIIEIQGVGRDITQRKQAEDQLKQQKTQLEQRNRALRQFNYAVSHELKTPLVTIESSLGLIQSTLPQAMDPELSKTFGYARHAARQMNLLLESLLLMFRIDATDSGTEATAFPVLVQDAVDRLTRKNRLEGIKVTIAAEGPLLCGDRHKLVQIWQHLIDNAAKYMGEQKHPAIDIGVEQTAQELLFFVRDNGMGIDKAYQEKIFGLFDQLDKTAGGTGMGLTLVQRIVEYYGGTIRVESAGADQGSCFYFTLPETSINQDTAI